MLHGNPTSPNPALAKLLGYSNILQIFLNFVFVFLNKLFKVNLDQSNPALSNQISRPAGEKNPD